MAQKRVFEVQYILSNSWAEDQVRRKSSKSYWIHGPTRRKMYMYGTNFGVYVCIHVGI